MITSNVDAIRTQFEILLSTGEIVMSDSSLRQDIFDELEYEPSIDAANVDVAVKDGIVTLTGNVTSFAQRMSLRDAVLRVRGVKAVVQEIEVVPVGTHAVTDEETARRTAAMLNWNVVVPENAVQVEVRQGWVQLTGNVEWQYQKDAAESAIWHMPGVVGVSNNIKIVPAISPADIKQRIEAAFKRDAALEAQAVTVSVTDGTVKLTGRVKAWTERRAAARAACVCPRRQGRRKSYHLGLTAKIMTTLAMAFAIVGGTAMKRELREKRVSRETASTDLLQQVHKEMPKRPQKPNSLSEILRKAKGGFSHLRLRRGLK